mmetsp:Transcript_42193/g.64693  ORF Transcript_42193/g.64693 Transcript_42193/m.64693 type:complete len:257 (+) Transcript_42193:436-1206(+)
MAESNLKEMMIDDINDDVGEEGQLNKDQPKIEWYLIDTERTFCKVWNFIINWVTIYSLIMTPFIMVFPHIYEMNLDQLPATEGGEFDEIAATAAEMSEYNRRKNMQETLRSLERAIDILFMIEILFNFVKRTRAYTSIGAISKKYVTSYFILDVLATVPNLFFLNEALKLYWLKFFRMIHLNKLTSPLELLLSYLLQKYSKKRQNDLTSFCSLILLVVYSSHLNACIWIWLGYMNECPKDDPGCTKSWIYMNDFDV